MVVKIDNLSDGKLALWNTMHPHTKVLVYTPPKDNMKRLYNSP